MKRLYGRFLCVVWYCRCIMGARKSLTPRQRKYVAEYVRNGQNGTQAMLKADPSLQRTSAAVQSSKELKNANIQQAISDALAKHELTAENAVGELAKIVFQDEELGAKRLAINDALLLMGWRKNDKPIMDIQVNQFFDSPRPSKVIDVEESES